MKVNVRFSCGLGALVAAAGSLRAQDPGWLLDSTVDLARGRRVVVAALDGPALRATTWGELVPTLILVCYNRSALVLRIVSEGAPALYGPMARLGFHLDSLPVQNLDANAVVLERYGNVYGYPSGAVLLEEYGYALDISMPPGDTASGPGRKMTRLLQALLTARQLRVRYQLLTGEFVAPEFRFGPETRSTVARVLHACQMEIVQ